MAKQPRKKPLTEAQVEALDRDNDGEAGGSLLKLGEHELNAICAEAYEAYDYQDERVRFDTLGRKWTFRPEKVGAGESVLYLEVKTLTVQRSDTISTALLASDMGREMATDVVRNLADGL